MPLIALDGAKDVILGMTANPSKNNISPFLERILTLCGGVGRYLELAIIQMSCADMDNTVIDGFKLNAYERFLTNMQTFQNIKHLLKNLTTAVLNHYPNVFRRFSESIELLSCYTLFQWPIYRKSVINQFSVGDLEKHGLVFLQPNRNAPYSFTYTCNIPFIALYWAIEHSNHNVQIPFLKDIKSCFSLDTLENISLRMMMAKLWGLTQKNSLTPDSCGLCTVMLSELLDLRYRQPDVEIKFRPEFTILDAPYGIDMCNYSNFKAQATSIAFANVKGFYRYSYILRANDWNTRKAKLGSQKVYW